MISFLYLIRYTSHSIEWKEHQTIVNANKTRIAMQILKLDLCVGISSKSEFIFGTIAEGGRKKVFPTTEYYS